MFSAIQPSVLLMFLISTVNSCNISKSLLDALRPHFGLHHIAFIDSSSLTLEQKVQISKKQLKDDFLIQWYPKYSSYHGLEEASVMFCPETASDLQSVATDIDKNNLGVRKPVFIWHSSTPQNESITPSRINQQIYHVTLNSMEVLEGYSINGHIVRNLLGHFKKDYIKRSIWIDFIPTKLGSKSLEIRRNNFHGYHIVAVTEPDPEAIYLDTDFQAKAKLHEQNKTYEVTNFLSGPYYNYVVHLSEMLNFTFSIYKRQDGQWASVDKTTGKLVGMIANLVEPGSTAEMIVTSFTTIPWRAEVVDYLPIISSDRFAITIRSQAIPTLGWSTFFNPFAFELWIVLLVIAIILAIWLHFANLDASSRSWIAKDHVKKLAEWIWVTGAANVGRKPVDSLKRNTWSNRIVLFTCLLVGNVTWIGFRASLTSELSFHPVKYPFISMEELHQSNYKLLTTQHGTAMASQFTGSKPGTIYNKLFKNNMDNSSFKDITEQLPIMVNSEEPFAFFNSKKATDETAASLFRCKVHVHVWESTLAQNLMSMAIRKNSSLKGFLSDGILKLVEQGKVRNELQKLKRPDNDCSPILREVTPMTVYKLVSLFVLIFGTMVASLLILAFEIISFKKANKKSNQTLDKDQDLEEAQQLVDRLQKIFSKRKDLEEFHGSIKNLSILLENKNSNAMI